MEERLSCDINPQTKINHKVCDIEPQIYYIVPDRKHITQSIHCTDKEGDYAKNAFTPNKEMRRIKDTLHRKRFSLKNTLHKELKKYNDYSHMHLENHGMCGLPLSLTRAEHYQNCRLHTVQMKNVLRDQIGDYEEWMTP